MKVNDSEICMTWNNEACMSLPDISVLLDSLGKYILKRNTTVKEVGF